MRLVRPALVVLVVFVVALAGCGGPPDTTEPSPTVGGTGVAGPSTDATRTTEPSPTAGGTGVAGPSTDATRTTGQADDSVAAGRTGTTDGSGVAANGTLEVHFINVGQSASTLLVTPTGETILVDSGDWRDDGAVVIDYLQRVGVERLDHLVTSHADADHIGGHAAVIEYFETQGEGVGAVYDPGIPSASQTYARYLDAVETYDVPLFRTRAGAQMPVTGVDVSVLGPPREPLENVDRNENSIVLRVTHGETSFLFTGDAEDDEERFVLSNYGSSLQSTVLLAGHHGSRSSTGDELLDAVDPRLVVLSSAYDSQYGHPHQETLDRLAARSIPAYWTATHGNVVLRSDGRAVTVSTQREATTDPTALRTEAPVEPGTADPVTRRTVIDVLAGDDGSVTVSTTTQTVAPDGGGEVTLVTVQAEGDGNATDEYVVFENTGESTLDLSGWRLEDAAGREYYFPVGFVLAPGARVTVHTGEGTDTDTDLYWGAGSAVWNNDGDTVILVDDEGTVVVREEYP
ncbi:lamin tail domain-containing protein [Haloarchaeobius sp. HRN-SO-5]|uniref:lamin tail domain-containing protein n=1 Tax=Haloarchaeobius sp. HRN-SO-5 TaxID=3446118 RepID=UPI003EBF8085